VLEKERRNFDYYRHSLLLIQKLGFESCPAERLGCQQTPAKELFCAGWAADLARPPPPRHVPAEAALQPEGVGQLPAPSSTTAAA